MCGMCASVGCVCVFVGHVCGVCEFCVCMCGVSACEFCVSLGGGGVSAGCVYETCMCICQVVQVLCVCLQGVQVPA